MRSASGHAIRDHAPQREEERRLFLRALSCVLPLATGRLFLGTSTPLQFWVCLLASGAGRWRSRWSSWGTSRPRPSTRAAVSLAFSWGRGGRRAGKTPHTAGVKQWARAQEADRAEQLQGCPGPPSRSSGCRRCEWAFSFLRPGCPRFVPESAGEISSPQTPHYFQSTKSPSRGPVN